MALALVIVGLVAYLRASDVSQNYEQTWPKSYKTTTCAEWNDEMTGDQQFAAAADLWWQRIKSRGEADRPDYRGVMSYRAAIDRECRVDTSAVLSKVAATFGFD